MWGNGADFQNFTQEGDTITLPVKTWEGNDFIAAANKSFTISFSPNKDGFEI
jgi:hypothetical protein